MDAARDEIKTDTKKLPNANELQHCSSSESACPSNDNKSVKPTQMAKTKGEKRAYQEDPRFDDDGFDDRCWSLGRAYRLWMLEPRVPRRRKYAIFLNN